MSNVRKNCDFTCFRKEGGTKSPKGKESPSGSVSETPKKSVKKSKKVSESKKKVYISVLNSIFGAVSIFTHSNVLYSCDLWPLHIQSQF